MRKISLVLGCVAALSMAAVAPAYADCKDNVQEIRDDIDKNKDGYTQEAKAKARKHLVQAEVPSLKLADCQREVAAAKQALRQGKK